MSRIRFYACAANKVRDRTGKVEIVNDPLFLEIVLYNRRASLRAMQANGPCMAHRIHGWKQWGVTGLTSVVVALAVQATALGPQCPFPKRSVTAWGHRRLPSL